MKASQLWGNSVLSKCFMIICLWILLISVFGALVSNVFNSWNMQTVVFQTVNNLSALYGHELQNIKKYVYVEINRTGSEDTTDDTSEQVVDHDNSTFRELFQLNYDTFPEDLGKEDLRNGEKYFIYRCVDRDKSLCGGWADRLKGMLAGYLIANITGRTFKAEIKTHGCRLEDNIVPNRVDWSLPVSFHDTVIKGKDVYVMNVLNSVTFFKRVNKINFKRSPMRRCKYVYFKANLDYTDGFRYSKFHRSHLSWMANRTRDQIIGIILRRLIKPSPEIQERLNEFLKKSLPNPIDKLVCAHVRMGRNPTIPKDTVVRNSPDNLPQVWRFLNSYSVLQNHKIFLASDSVGVIEEAKRQAFKENLLLVPGEISHVERSFGMEDANACKALEKATLEFFLLMHCDVLMISKSGFSRLPAYVRGSDQGLYCLVDDAVAPCKLESLKELYRIMG